MIKDMIARLRGIIFLFKCKVLNKKVAIGPGLRMYKRLTINGDGKVIIGKDCIIKGIPGDKSQYVTIDTHSKSAVVKIGDFAKLCAARISSRHGVEIGDYLIIEEGGIADTDFHSINKDRGEPLDENPEKCKIKIGHHVGLASKSMVTKGVTVGDHVVIGPGAILTKSVQSGVFMLGNPAIVWKK